MKFFARIVLGIFILFQFSTIIICIINSRSETTFTYNITEEEEHSKGTKELKSEFIVTNYKLVTPFVENPSKKVQDTYLLKHYVANSPIFILPPEQV